MTTTVASDEGSGADRQRPLFVVEPGRIRLRQYVRDLSHHRDLIQVLALRDIKLRYRQTALGASWVVLQPLLAAGILSFVFGRIAKLPADGIPYFVFSFAGLLGWGCFGNTVTRTTSSLVANASLVTKIFFPRLVLPLSTIFAVLVDFCVGFVVLAVMWVVADVLPDARLLLTPVWVVLFVMLGQGLGSFLAAIAVRYRDVPHITPVLLQLWLYASPVAYSVSAVPARFERVYFANPMAGLLQAFRWSVLGTSPPPGGALAYAVVTAVVVFVVGAIALEKMERKFPDVI